MAEIPGFLASPEKQPLDSFNISCIDGSDGEVWLIFGSGIYPPYNYWLTNPVGDTIDTGTAINGEVIKVGSLYKGTYEMIVKDDAGCYNSWHYELKEPNPMNIEWSSPVYIDPYNISCNGYNNGSIKVDNVFGGNGNYSYFWTGSITGDPTERDQSNLIAGTYYLEITDTLGCVSTDSITLIEPDGIELIDSVLSVTADGNNNISCNGGSDGSIDITIQGGSGEYTFNWTGPVGSGIDPTAEDQSGITDGSYNVQVSDEIGCGKYYSFELTEPESLEISSILSVSIDGNFNINCSGGNEGDIDITVSGGSVGNYSYQWSTTNGSGLTETDEDQSGLTAGTYNVIVTDLNGCTIERTYMVTEPEPLEASIIGTDITCDPGLDDGMADLTVTGGTGQGTYSFIWSNGETREDITGLVEGIYIVTVTDERNCTIKDSVRMHLPPPLIFRIDSISAYNDVNISCYGYMDGLIHTSVISGTPVYNYSWTGPDGFISSDSVIVNLGAGIYNLHVVDSKNCMGDSTIELTEPDSLIMAVSTSGSLVGGYNLNCYGDNNATIDLEISGGTPEYIYSWTTGEITASLSMLEAGNYAVVVRDQNSCSIDSSISITQPEPLSDSAIVTDAYCPDLPNGEIILNVTGGVVISGYTYLWSNNATTENITDLKTDTYSVLITDDNLCELRDTFIVYFERSACLKIPTGFSPNGDNINDIWRIGIEPYPYIEIFELYPNVVIEIFNRWGELVFRSDKGYTNPWDGTFKGKMLPIDSYHYVINLHDGTKSVVGNITIVR